RIYSIFFFINLYDVGIRKDYPHQWEWTVSQWLMDYQNQLSWGDRRDFHRSLFRLDPLRLSLTLATLKKESEVKKIDVNHALSKVLNIHLSKLNQPMTFKMRSELFTEVDERKTDIKAFTKSGKSPYRKLYGVLQVCEWPTVNKVLGEKSHVPNILYVKHCGKALFNSGIYSKKEVNAFLTKFSKLPFISFHRGSLKLFVKLKTIPLEKKYSPYEWKKILESTSISYDTKLMAHHPLSAIEVVPFYRVN
ncbi:MAG: hypothetical protein KDD61_08590, partial [Bdellovibrionales bacterium]|nr:hypothetical protein [Bdellovibrionales bacterium]